MPPIRLRLSNPMISLPSHHIQLTTQLTHLLLQPRNLTPRINRVLPQLLHPQQLTSPRIHIRRPTRSPIRKKRRNPRTHQSSYRNERRRIHGTFPPATSGHDAITPTAYANPNQIAADT